MKIYLKKITKSFVIVVTITILFLSLFAACTIFEKQRELNNVKSIPAINATFEAEDIFYDDMSSLRQALQNKQRSVINYIADIKHYQKNYPDNEELKHKLERYQSYLESLETYSFSCPEHIASKQEARTKPCRDCEESGEIGIFFKEPCEECDGEGAISYEVIVPISCPHCNKNYKSYIPAKEILHW